ncbi:MAG: hypothetical protein P3W95_009205 [Tepidimonas taiwanensis]|nr:hypothetical protein [Tepidimonas taiwanensis]
MLRAALAFGILSASLWLWRVEGFVSGLLFFVLGLAITGALIFMLDLGAAVGGSVDAFVRRFGHKRQSTSEDRN